jgi:hypothetical protein
MTVKILVTNQIWNLNHACKICGKKKMQINAETMVQILFLEAQSCSAGQ